MADWFDRAENDIQVAAGLPGPVRDEDEVLNAEFPEGGPGRFGAVAAEQSRLSSPTVRPQ